MNSLWFCLPLVISPFLGTSGLVLVLAASSALVSILLGLSAEEEIFRLLSMVLLWPLSFLLISALLKLFCRFPKNIQLLAFLGASLFTLSDRGFLEAFVQASSGPTTGWAVNFAGVIGRVILASSICAACVMLAELAFELPACWVARLSSTKIILPCDAIRVFFVLILCSMSLNLIVDFLRRAL